MYGKWNTLYEITDSSLDKIFDLHGGVAKDGVKSTVNTGIYSNFTALSWSEHFVYYRVNEMYLYKQAVIYYI